MPEFNGSQSSGRIALTTPGANLSSVTRPDDSDFVLLRLQEAMADAKERGAQQLKLDRAFVEAIIKAMDVRRANFFDLKGKFDGVKVRYTPDFPRCVSKHRHREQANNTLKG